MTKTVHTSALKSFWISVFLLISTIAISQKQVPELWNMRVHDDAHVLNGTTIDELESRLKKYEDSTSNQIAILIVNSLDGEAIEEYSIRVAEKWQLGQKAKDNGILLLIAIDDRKMRIEVGEGLEGVVTDAVSNRIIRNEMAPAFRRGEYDAGVNSAIDAIIKAIGGEYSADDTESNVELTTKERVLIGLGLYLFLSLFAFFALVIKGCTGWGLYAFLIPFYTLFPAAILMNENNWYVPGLIYILGFPPLKIWVSKTSWGKRVSEKMGSGSSTGRSGWGGWSSGGGGWSSGGGFSGGGGSFGGGGSSGSW
jgi:uncharacterized protein